MARLRDKSISPAGLARLNANLRLLQAAFQHILPTDLAVYDAVRRYMGRPAVFLRYIAAHDVVNELIATEDYARFTTAEVEALIRLVFRQADSEAGDDRARGQIALFHAKLKELAGPGRGWGRAGSTAVDSPRPTRETPPKAIAPDRADPPTPGSPRERGPTAKDGPDEARKRLEGKTPF
ncbi:unnamed protein product [Phytomonas sp. Hart1]|nr:unnamed protein product [Phytomonas sp. Hart1]|eukprot:CCW70370.1 unnamed protein product [Phytomonas sp. isolate Hart1]